MILISHSKALKAIFRKKMLMSRVAKGAARFIVRQADFNYSAVSANAIKLFHNNNNII